MAFGLVGALVEVLMEGPEGMDYASMSIAGINPVDGSLQMDERTLQYWPDTLADTIDIGWNFKDIPGASTSLAQWGANGGRTFSFEVQYHRFMKPHEPRSAFDMIRDPFGLNTPDAEYLKDNRPHNVDVAAEIRYLRAMCYPTYTSSKEQGVTMLTASPPPIVVLVAPGMGLSEDGEDYVYCVMTGCDVTYTLLFPNGVPRRATVALTLRQIVQRKSGIYWAGHSDDALVQLTTDMESNMAKGGGHKGNAEQITKAKDKWNS